MDLFQVIERRHSCRAFEARDVEPDKIERILGAVRLAPSAGGLQAFTIVTVREKWGRSQLADAAYGQDFVAQAPIVLAFLADERRSEAKYHERGATLFSIQDATIAALYAQLVATAEGLASCWVGAFDEGRVAAILDAPSRLRPVALMPIGYSAEKPKPCSRRPLRELVKSEHA
jgi:nitroreductase